MCPYINVLGLQLPLYGIMMMLGVAASIGWFIYAERKESLRRFTVNRMLFVMIIGLIVMYLSAGFFNSLFHTIEEGELYIGGITWLGGVVGVVVFMIIGFHFWVPEAKGNAFKYFSLMIPGLVIGHAFGRMGCFFGGCCFGRPTTSWLGVVFPDGSEAAKMYGYGVKVLPTQLFEAVFELVLFIVLLATRKKNKYWNVEIYLIVYCVFRFVLEFFRGDDRGATGLFLSPAQFLCIIAVTAAILIILNRKGIIFKKLYSKTLVWQRQAEQQMAIIDKQIEDSHAVDSIGKLYELKEKGLITEEEYNERKKQLLDKI